MDLNATIPNGHGVAEYTFDDVFEDDYFNISFYGGVIKTKMKFNYDVSPKHKFVIIVRNSLDSKKLAISAVIVNIIDFNDHSPVFVTKSKDIFIEESTGVDRLVATVQARDEDKGSNADLTYKIVSGNTNYAFKVNNIGEVRVNNSLNSATKDFYTLMLRAEDGGIPKRMSESLYLRISVNAKSVVDTPKHIIDIPISQSFTNKQYESYDVELQLDDNGDEDCKLIYFNLTF